METETKGAGVKPPEVEVATAAAPGGGTVCPETGEQCNTSPQCILGTSSACYCALWVKRIRYEEMQKRSGA